MSLDFCCDIQMVGSEFGIKNMKAWIHMVHAGGGVMVSGIFSWHTLGPLVPIEHRLNTTAYLSIVADHVHPFMTTVYPSSDGYFQQDNAPCHKAQIISDWFLEHDNEFTLLKWPPQSPDLNPIEHLWDVVERDIRIMDVQPTNLQQLMLYGCWWMLSCHNGPKSLRNVSNTLLNLCHKELRQFWRQKGVQPGTSKVYLIKWPVSLYINTNVWCHMKEILKCLKYLKIILTNNLTVFIIIQFHPKQFIKMYTILCSTLHLNCF